MKKEIILELTEEQMEPVRMALDKGAEEQESCGEYKNADFLYSLSEIIR